VHHNVHATRGIHGHTLHGQLPAGAQTVHEREGAPTRFQSDRGEQLVVAAKQVSTWDFKEVIQWAGKNGIEWTLVPTGGQHFNGQAERMIGLIKKQLWKIFEGKKLSHEET
jgi:hypothetical protein